MGWRAGTCAEAVRVSGSIVGSTQSAGGTVPSVGQPLAHSMPRPRAQTLKVPCYRASCLSFHPFNCWDQNCRDEKRLWEAPEALVLLAASWAVLALLLSGGWHRQELPSDTFCSWRTFSQWETMRVVEHRVGGETEAGEGSRGGKQRQGVRCDNPLASWT